MIDILEFTFLHTAYEYIILYIQQIIKDIKNNLTISNNCDIDDIEINHYTTIYLIKIKPKNKNYYIEIKYMGDWNLCTSYLYISPRMNDDNSKCFFDPKQIHGFTGWNLWFLWIDTQAIIDLIIHYINEDNKENYIYY
jgi:hypothetical protein